MPSLTFARHGKGVGVLVSWLILDRDWLGQGDHNASKNVRSDRMNLGHCGSREDNVDKTRAITDC